jgi:hypothetical protein
MLHVPLYQSYQGDKPYVFLRYSEYDSKIASDLINHLIDRQFRIYYDIQVKKKITDSEWIATKISQAELMVFLISGQSLESLEFRNSINFAISLKKTIFCLYLNDEKPGYGFDMQLSNVPSAKLSEYANVTELFDSIVKKGLFLQQMRSESAKVPIQNNLRKTTAIAAIITVIAITLILGSSIMVYRIRYENSIEGQLKQLTSTDYLDLSGEKASTIELLKGKTITTLLVRNMGLTELDALVDVNCEQLDLSNNPQVTTLEPLLNNASLKIIKLTQDMYPAVARLNGQYPFKIIITE